MAADPALQASHSSEQAGNPDTLLPDPAAAARYQASSKRTTTDSVLDRMLNDISTAGLSRQPSAAARQARAPPGSNTAHDLHDAAHHTDAVQQPSTSKPLQSSTSSSRRNSFSNADSAAAAFIRPADAAHPQTGLRVTADSALDGVLRQVEDDADQASVDSLLDGVLEQVAGAVTRQRTTADSVLDAMLDDLAGSQADALADASCKSKDDAQEDHMLQPHIQAVSSHLADFCRPGSTTSTMQTAIYYIDPVTVLDF